MGKIYTFFHQKANKTGQFEYFVYKLRKVFLFLAIYFLTPRPLLFEPCQGKACPLSVIFRARYGHSYQTLLNLYLNKGLENNYFQSFETPYQAFRIHVHQYQVLPDPILEQSYYCSYFFWLQNVHPCCLPSLFLCRWETFNVLQPLLKALQ